MMTNPHTAPNAGNDHPEVLSAAAETAALRPSAYRQQSFVWVSYGMLALLAFWVDSVFSRFPVGGALGTIALIASVFIVAAISESRFAWFVWADGSRLRAVASCFRIASMFAAMGLMWCALYNTRGLSCAVALIVVLILLDVLASSLADIRGHD